MEKQYASTKVGVDREKQLLKSLKDRENSDGVKVCLDCEKMSVWSQIQCGACYSYRLRLFGYRLREVESPPISILKFLADLGIVGFSLSADKTECYIEAGNTPEGPVNISKQELKILISELKGLAGGMV